MSKKNQNRFKESCGGDIERTLLTGNRRTYPGVEIQFLREESWESGRIYINVSRDSECMSIDHFEVFIAQFTKIVEIARRKQEELHCLSDYDASLTEMPEIELNYNSTCSRPQNLMLVISENGSSMSCTTAERFIEHMQKLLKEARDIDRLPVPEE